MSFLLEMMLYYVPSSLLTGKKIGGRQWEEKGRKGLSYVLRFVSTSYIESVKTN